MRNERRMSGSGRGDERPTAETRYGASRLFYRCQACRTGRGPRSAPRHRTPPPACLTAARTGPVGSPGRCRDQVQKPVLHGYVRYISCPHLVRLVDRLAAQKVWVDLVLGMPLAGVPLRPDRPKPELPHQPPDASTADRNPLAQQRHLKPAAAVDWMVRENPIEPLQKVELLRTFRPWPVIKAAARHPEQRALRVTDSPASGAIIARLSARERW